MVHTRLLRLTPSATDCTLRVQTGQGHARDKTPTPQHPNTPRCNVDTISDLCDQFRVSEYGSTVLHHEIGTGISEASKRVSIFVGLF